MKKSKIFYLALFFIFNLLYASELKFSQVNSLEWQMVTLQESIEKKIIKSLTPIINEDEFIIEVKITIDKDAQNSPSSKNVTTTKQAKKIQFNNSDAPSNSEDYVIFNKFGLEAPVVGEEPVEIKTSEAELNQKAMIELNERYNIFKYLQSININLTFDKGLPKQTKETVRKIIQGLSFNLEGLAPQINIQFLDLQSSKIAKIEKIKKDNESNMIKGELKQTTSLKTFFEKMENIDIMFGIIMASLILASALFYLAKQTKNSSASNANSNPGATGETSNSKNGGQNSDSSPPNESGESGLPAGTTAQQLLNKDDESENDQEDDMKIDLSKKDPTTTRINEELERFKKVYTNHQNQTILMMKGWIKSMKPNDSLALRSLIQTLTDNELAEIFNLLTIDERSAWKMCLTEELSKEEVAKGFTYIGQKVMEMMMVPSFIDDYEVCDLLLDISAEDAAKFSKEKKELGIIFVNVLTSKIISEMFKQMPDELVIDLIDSAQNYSKSQVLSKIPLLKEKLVEIKAKREKPPFIMRIYELLPTAKAEIEPKLYSTLLKNFSLEEVKNTSIKNLPTSLVNKLPDNIFKQVIALMPLESQVMFFATKEKEERDEYLNKFAPKGSKTREMIELELNPIIKNELQLKKLQNDKKELIIKEYLNFARHLISNTADVQKEVMPILEGWLIEIREHEKPVKAVS